VTEKWNSALGRDGGESLGDTSLFYGHGKSRKALTIVDLSVLLEYKNLVLKI
jgi:hypothetical protein